MQDHELRAILLALLEDQLERDPAVRHVAAQRLVQVELAALEPAPADREDVLDPLGEALDHLAHLADLLLGEVVEALLEQRLAPELLHVVVVLLLELALGERAHAAAQRLHAAPRSAGAARRSARATCRPPRAAPRGPRARRPAPSMPSCSSVRRLKKPTWRKFSIRSMPACSAAWRIRFSSCGEVLGEQRARELGEVAAELALHALEHLRDLLQQLLEVHAQLAEARGGLAERLAQAVVEARPEQVEELVVGRRPPRRA